MLKNLFERIKSILAWIVALPGLVLRFVNGWKTRLVMLSGAALQLAVMLDPVMISTAFGLNQQWAAAVALGLFILGWLAREVAQKPGAIAAAMQKQNGPGND